MTHRSPWMIGLVRATRKRTAFAALPSPPCKTRLRSRCHSLPGAINRGKAASRQRPQRVLKAGAKVLKLRDAGRRRAFVWSKLCRGVRGRQRKRTEDKLAKATPDDLRASNVYGSDFLRPGRKFSMMMSADDAATATTRYWWIALLAKGRSAAISTPDWSLSLREPWR